MIIDLFGNMGLLFLLGIVVAILGVVFMFFGVRSGLKKGNRLSKRFEQFVELDAGEEESATTRRIIQREFSGSLVSRTIGSWFNKLLKFFGRFTPARMVSEMDRKLTIAGNPYNLHAKEFFSIRLLVFIAACALAFWMNRDLANLDFTIFLLGVFIIIISFIFPNSWLNSLVKKKQDEIRRSLPDALDMLSVCASAGLGFDQSLQKISSYWENELGRKFKRVAQEMEMGSSRTEALKNMSSQVDVDDLTQFITIIVQAEIIGMSYSDVLHTQALQMRMLRQYRAKEVANKLPGKMIIPLATMIFPALLMVILGPAISQIMQIL